MDKYLTASQPDSVNDDINSLRYRAFHSNSEQDRSELLYILLKYWSDGELVSRNLMDKIYE